MVQDSKKTRYLLSTDSVLLGKVGAPVIQPAEADGGLATDEIAKLVATIEPTAAGASRVAIARFADGFLISPTVEGFGKIAGIAETKQGDEIQVVARGSIHKGKVLDSDATMLIELEGQRHVSFEHVITTDAGSVPGDSGAPVLTSDYRLVGVLYAGTQKLTVVIPIKPILEKLKLDLIQ